MISSPYLRLTIRGLLAPQTGIGPLATVERVGITTPIEPIVTASAVATHLAWVLLELRYFT